MKRSALVKGGFAALLLAGMGGCWINEHLPKDETLPNRLPQPKPRAKVLEFQQEDWNLDSAEKLGRVASQGLDDFAYKVFRNCSVRWPNNLHDLEYLVIEGDYRAKQLQDYRAKIMAENPFASDAEIDELMTADGSVIANGQYQNKYATNGQSVIAELNVNGINVGYFQLITRQVYQDGAKIADNQNLELEELGIIPRLKGNVVQVAGVYINKDKMSEAIKGLDPARAMTTKLIEGQDALAQKIGYGVNLFLLQLGASLVENGLPGDSKIDGFVYATRKEHAAVLKQLGFAGKQELLEQESTGAGKIRGQDMSAMQVLYYSRDRLTQIAQEFSDQSRTSVRTHR